jgi:hypothetical protein
MNGELYMSSNKISYYTSAFAFIDVLGTSNAMQNEKDCSFLNTMNNMYKSAIHIAPYCIDPKIKHKIFSDNIVFERIIKSNDDPIQIALQLIEFLAIIQEFFSDNNKLIRGGVTIGQSYLSDNLVLGPALLETYELESKKAIYPRILISDTIISKLNSNNYNSKLIKKDRDNKYFIDYLKTRTKNCDYIKNKINNYISFLEKELSNETDTRIKAKLLWSINYCKERLKELMNN